MPIIRRREFPNFEQTATDWRRFKNNINVYAGNTAVNFFKDSFSRKGFIDKGFTRWKDRKPPKGKKKARGSLLLVSARLKNSIKIRAVNTNGVHIATDVPYAPTHNEGSRKLVSVRPHKRTPSRTIKVKSSNLKTKRTSTRRVTFAGKTHNVKGYSYKQNISQRQFMGDSEFLMKRIETHLFRSLDTFAKNLFK